MDINLIETEIIEDNLSICDGFLCCFMRINPETNEKEYYIYNPERSIIDLEDLINITYHFQKLNDNFLPMFISKVNKFLSINSNIDIEESNDSCRLTEDEIDKMYNDMIEREKNET